MNTIQTEINEVRKKLKALEIKLFLQGAGADVDSTVMEDVEAAMACLAKIENKVANAFIILGDSEHGTRNTTA